jgi:hypothetical protein
VIRDKKMMMKENQKETFKTIRHRRAIVYFMFLIFVPYGVLFAYFSETNIIPISPIIPISIYMVLLTVLSLRAFLSKCPSCGDFFFYRSKQKGEIGDTGNNSLNFLFGGGYRNITTNSCLNCNAQLKS